MCRRVLHLVAVGAMLFAARAAGAGPTELSKPRRTLNTGQAWLTHVQFAPGGNFLAAAGDGVITIWDVRNGARRQTLRQEARLSVRQLAFAPDGQQLAVCSVDGYVRLWDVKERRVIDMLPGRADSSAIAYSPDGEILARGTTAGVVELHRAGLGGPRRLRTKHPDRILDLAFTPDGRKLLSVDRSGLVSISDVGSALGLGEHRLEWEKRIEHAIELRGTARRVTVTENGMWAVGNVDLELVAMNLVTGRKRVLGERISFINNPLAFHPREPLLATQEPGEPVKVRDLRTGTLRMVVRIGGREADAIAFSPDGYRMATARAGTVDVWDLEGALPGWLALSRAGNFAALAYSPSGDRLAGGSSDGRVTLWDTTTGATQARLAGPEGGVRVLAFAPDGRTLAAGGGHHIQLWDVARRKPRELVTGPDGAVLGLAYSPDGRTLAAALTAGRIVLWETAGGTRIAVLLGHKGTVYAVAFGDGGNLLASAGADATARLWDVATGRELARLPHTVAIEALAYGTDGASLLTASTDGVLTCWDIDRRKPRWRKSGMGEGIWRLALERRGRFLVTSNLERGPQMWDYRLLASTFRVRLKPEFNKGADLWTFRPQRGLRPLPPLDSGGEPDMVRAIAVAPDGKSVATAGSEGGVTVWFVRPPR